MKKVFLFIGLSLSVVFVNAQVNYGLKGGLNISTIGGSDADDVKAKFGFHVGGYAQIPVHTNLSIQPELQYSLMGWKEDETGEDTKINTSFIAIPVMGKYTFSNGIFAETGPQFGILISAKAKNDGDSENIKDQLKGSSFFWNFGLGYQPSGSAWGAGVRYNLGLSRIDDDADWQAFHRVWQFSISYQLGSASK